jgi:hypothetical protein
MEFYKTERERERERERRKFGGVVRETLPFWKGV